MAEREPEHPDRELLEAFAQGRLGPDHEAAVEAHVAACDSCCERIQSMPEDRFVALLRATAGPPPPIETPEAAQQALGGAQQAGHVDLQIPSSFVLTGGPPTLPTMAGPPPPDHRPRPRCRRRWPITRGIGS